MAKSVRPAINREFMEEIGAVPEILDQIGEFVVREDDKEKVVAKVYLCKISSDIIKLSPEHSEFILINPRNLTNYSVHIILSQIDFGKLINLT